MGKVIFSIRYQILEDKREDYLGVIRELKSLIGAEGLESYSVFEQKGKANHFEEIYIFESKQAYEDFDDDPTERVDLLMNKLSDMVKQQSTTYSTLIEV
jgi:quinol monooxygenase YgiN